VPVCKHGGLFGKSMAGALTRRFPAGQMQSSQSERLVAGNAEAETPPCCALYDSHCWCRGLGESPTHADPRTIRSRVAYGSQSHRRCCGFPGLLWLERSSAPMECVLARDRESAKGCSTNSPRADPSTTFIQ
jgi:hypothetical protein